MILIYLDTFEYLNSCVTEWRIDPDVVVCLAIEADGILDLEHTEVGANDV